MQLGVQLFFLRRFVSASVASPVRLQKAQVEVGGVQRNEYRATRGAHLTKSSHNLSLKVFSRNRSSRPKSSRHRSASPRLEARGSATRPSGLRLASAASL